MLRAATFTFLATVLFLGGGQFGEVQAQYAPTMGCLSNGTCKAPSPANTPNDFWHNWVCLECHVGPSAGLAPSRVERDLIASPARFWSMHAEAGRDPETRRRTAAYRDLKSLRELSPAIKQLLDQRR